MSGQWAFKAWDAAMWLAVRVVLAPRERLLGRGERGTGSCLEERLGRWSPAVAPGAARLVVHAVSVGEVAAAGGLVSALARLAPQVSVLLTTGTREGRAAAERLRRICPSIEAVTSLPWDRRRALETWLLRLRPRGVVVIETEIWPGLFRAAERLSIPVFIASGRVYPKDVGRYRLVRPFLARVLEAATWIGAQSPRERDAFLAIGAPVDRVEVAGDLKVDAPARWAELPKGWCDALAQRNGALLVAGSTHHPEERLLLRSLCRLRTRDPKLRMVLAPRHPGRAPRLERQVRAASLRAALWSGGPATDWDVLLLDEVGPLAGVYSLADVVVLGGSLAPCGGHSPMEPAAAGRATVIGPFHEHFQDMVDSLDEAGGIRVLSRSELGVDGLCAAVGELLLDSELRACLGGRAAALLASRRGAAEHHARTILSGIREPAADADLLG